jgi:hypothetical protein
MDNPREERGVIVTTPNATGSPTTFKPMRDPETDTDMVVTNPAPHAAAPRVASYRVIKSGE